MKKTSGKTPSIDVSHVAKLAALPLSKEETEKFEKQLDETLAYIERLNEIDTEGTLSTNQVTGLKNIADEDVASPSLPQEDVLRNAPSKHNGFFKVKAILDS